MHRPALLLAAGIAVVAVVVAAATVALTRGDGGGDATTATATSTTAPPPTGSTTSTAPEPAVAPHEQALAVAEEPSDPAALAQAIEDAERAIRDPQTPDDHVEGWAWVQQRAYRTLARMPEWDAAVAGAVDADLVAAVEANTRANRELWALTAPREQLPDWMIVAPPPADELLGHYRAAEAETGVGWQYLAAIHLVESRMGRIRGASVAGAQGPMQFLPSTWEAYGEGDINDYRDAIKAAGRYLADHGAPADMRRALFAYNRSDHYVDAVEAYAMLMAEDERAYLGYYHWQVYYRLVSGDVLLEEGWSKDEVT